MGEGLASPWVTCLRCGTRLRRLSSAHGYLDVFDGITPTNNLTLQSQIINRAEAFVGTYGGLSYLGPYDQVPTKTFYSARLISRRVRQLAIRHPILTAPTLDRSIRSPLN